MDHHVDIRHEPQVSVLDEELREQIRIPVEDGSILAVGFHHGVVNLNLSSAEAALKRFLSRVELRTGFARNLLRLRYPRLYRQPR